MNTESKALERAKNYILWELDWECPVKYLDLWEVVSAKITWKIFLVAMKELRAENKIYNIGGYRKR